MIVSREFQKSRTPASAPRWGAGRHRTARRRPACEERTVADNATVTIRDNRCRWHDLMGASSPPPVVYLHYRSARSFWGARRLPPSGRAGSRHRATPARTPCRPQEGGAGRQTDRCASELLARHLALIQETDHVRLGKLGAIVVAFDLACLPRLSDVTAKAPSDPVAN